MAIYKSVTELVGRTPLVELTNIEKQENISAVILAKVESFNPAGSIKDRIANGIINEAEKSGRLKKGSVIIEPTSGNTGIGIASAATAKGYRAIIVMPETMSEERKMLIKAYGAELVLTEGSKGMKGATEKAEELHREIPGSIIAGQFTNPVNPQTHYETTGPEIWEDTNGNVDIFVAGVGTGGTLSGVGKFLKEKNADIKVVAVEPETSPLLLKGQAGPHKIQGIGANFIPDTLDRSIYDEIIAVPNKEAILTARNAAKQEGFLIGISSGAALWAAKQLAEREENKGKNIVVIFPDGGERYLSANLYE